VHESLVSSAEWPVFDEYALVENNAGEMCIGPAEGAVIRARVNLDDPALRSAALKAAMPLTKSPRKPGRPRKVEVTKEDYPRDLTQEERDRTTPDFWRPPQGSCDESPVPEPKDFPFTVPEWLTPLGKDQQGDLIKYVSAYGLFGLGPSRILRAEQRLACTPWWLTIVVRRAGQLVAIGLTEPQDGQGTYVDLEDPLGNRRPSWEQRYCLAGATVAEVFAHEIGSEEWWRFYVEPVKEIPRALKELLFPGGLETRLADTFVDLSRAEGARVIDRRTIEWRSISAIGALSLAVLNGGLNGWEICPYCSDPFEPGRKGQIFCQPWHRKRFSEQKRSRVGQGSK
jgi:hypothetical protein